MYNHDQNEFKNNIKSSCKNKWCDATALSEVLEKLACKKVINGNFKRSYNYCFVAFLFLFLFLFLFCFVCLLFFLCSVFSQMIVFLYFSRFSYFRFVCLVFCFVLLCVHPRCFISFLFSMFILLIIRSLFHICFSLQCTIIAFI